MTRRNDHQADAGADGRTLANRDLWKVDAVLPGGDATVRLVLGRDENDRVILGQPRTLAAAYLREHAQLAYGMTSYAVQGATFGGNGYAVVRPEDDREYLYTAMTRARGGNFAFAVNQERELGTASPQPSPKPGGPGCLPPSAAASIPAPTWPGPRRTAPGSSSRYSAGETAHGRRPRHWRRPSPMPTASGRCCRCGPTWPPASTSPGTARC